MNDLIKQTFWVSAVYLLAFFFTIWMFFPLQEQFIVLEAEWISLVFLPHGVRILTAWLFGLRSIILLLPSALITHMYIFGWEGFELGLLTANLVGVLSGYLAFELVKGIGFNTYPVDGKTIDWRKLIVVGAIASVINSLGSKLIYQTTTNSTDILSSILGYLFGDVAGLMMAMVILMFVFRHLRFRSAPRRILN